MTFKIGMKVVCVKVPFDPPPGRVFPVEGRVYTVRGIRPYRTWSILLLDECVNAAVWTDVGFCEQGFCAACFRPAVSPKQQVSFTTGAPLDSEQWDCRRKRVEVEA